LAVILTVLFLLTGLLPGCQSMGAKDIGRQVPSGGRVVLQDGGPHAQTFQTRDMTIKYQYRTAGSQLKVWGTTAIKYESIKTLIFHLFFLDADGKVIAIHDFFSYLDHSDFAEFKSDERQFHRDFTMPDGAKAFAIGYDGETMHSADQEQIDFFYAPFD
jgi:hypothetical protein